VPEFQITVAEEMVERWAASDAHVSGNSFDGMAAVGLFGVGLGGADGQGSYAAIARVEAALVARTGLLGLGGAWAGRQLVARFFIEGFGTAAQRSAFIPRIVAGEALAAVAVSEPGVGAHPKHLSTRAEPRGQDFRITGEKAWVTNGPDATVFVVFAVTRVEGERKRYAAFLVPRETPGLSLKDMPEFRLLAPSRHAGLMLDGCAVAREAMLGAEGEAYETMALPFRDVEDAVGLSGLAGAFRWLTVRLGAAGLAGEEAAQSLGRLVALGAVLEEGARSVVDGLAAGRLPAHAAAAAGLRLLANDLLAHARSHRDRFAPRPDEQVDRMFADLDASLSVARGPRAARLTRLGRTASARPPA
jgi:acyl-CoA dehydrogenase